MQYDNSAIAEVLVDALTRRTWIKEEDLAKAVLLNPKQVRKALHYLEEERLVTRSHVKEKDKDREARTRQRAEENGVDEGVIMERIRNIEKKTVTYVCLNYSRIVDALTLRLETALAELRFKIEKGPVAVLYRCANDPELCGRRYSSLDAARLMDMSTGLFKCQVCQHEVVQLGGGEDGAPPEPRTKEGLKAILATFETQIAPVYKQLQRVKGLTPPQYGTLNEWVRVKRRAAERAASGGGGGGRGGGLQVQADELEDTKFEVTLGLTQEQEAAMEAEANAPKLQPEWITRNQFGDDVPPGTTDAQRGNNDAQQGGGAAAEEEAIQAEWLRAYLNALQEAKQEHVEGPAGGEGAAPEASAGEQMGGSAHKSTDDLVAEAMGFTGATEDFVGAAEGDDEEWDDVGGEDDEWEDA